MKIYICNIQPYMELKDIELLSLQRQEKVHRYKQVKDKARCLVGGLLLREFCGVTEDNQLGYGKHGKPYLIDSSMHFNLSHSGDYVVLAVANDEVGIDIEKIKSFPKEKEVASRVFTSTERKWLEQEHTKDKENRFYRLWTGKESVMKAIGLGFSLPADSFSVSMNPNSCMINEEEWFLDWLVHDEHIICYATKNSAENPELIIV